ncbi:MAG: DUF4974 domain-containing protein [Prevotella sp.]|jgi:hypothetical protein|nr:DUF4974 domain-containing protein [Prevotella sp.]
MNRTGQTDKLAQVLDAIERPERYTNEQLLQLLSDEQCSDYYRLMCDATSAYAGSHTVSTVDIDAEWQKFSRQHMNSSLRIWRKIAAVFVGLMMISGLSYAAIHMINSESSAPAVENVESTPAKSVVTDSPNQTATADMVYTFENAELEVILTEVARYYQLRPEFRSDEARHIRLYIKWNKEEDAQTMVERLNRFEKVNVTLTNGHIIAQ